MGPVQQTKHSIQVHWPHKTSSKIFGTWFCVFHSRWQLLVRRSDLTIFALLLKTISDCCAPHMQYDTSKQAQRSWRSFPLRIYVNSYNPVMRMLSGLMSPWIMWQRWSVSTMRSRWTARKAARGSRLATSSLWLLIWFTRVWHKTQSWFV